MTRAWWKWLGLAGVVGVVATGTVVARQQRRQRDYAPDELRERLHRRHDEAVTRSQPVGVGRTPAFRAGH